MRLLSRPSSATAPAPGLRNRAGTLSDRVHGAVRHAGRVPRQLRAAVRRTGRALRHPRRTLRRVRTAIAAALRRARGMFGEMWRFSLVGITNLLINFAVFNALSMTLFQGGELKANVVATVFATTTSYLMNRFWTFRHRRTTRIRREYVLFFLFNGVGLAIELSVMAAAKYGLGLTGLLALNAAKVAGIGMATVFRFWTYRTFVFSGRPHPAPVPASAVPAGPGTGGPGTGEPGRGEPGRGEPGRGEPGRGEPGRGEPPPGRSLAGVRR